jgi:WD40 repeat protein
MSITRQSATVGIGVSAILSGCTGPTSSPSAFTSAGEQAAAAYSSALIDLTAAPPKIFVSKNGSIVTIYSAQGEQVGSIAFHLPSGETIHGGLATDASRDLYVGDTANVDVFPAPYSAKQMTLEVSGRSGFYSLAVDHQTGLVAGANQTRSRNIALWKKGDTAPCKELSNEDAASISGVAFDAENNLFLTASDRDGRSHIFEVSGGCSATGVRELTFSNQLAEIGGVQINAADQPVVSDDDNHLYTYARPSGNSLGAPIETTTVSDGFRHFAFTANGKALWIIGQTSVAEYSYPSGGSPIAYISKTTGAQESDADITISPALRP